MSRNALLTAAACSMLLTASGCCSTQKCDATAPAQRDGVFIHIRSGTENPHAVLMGLKMASLMTADRDVLVYFDLKAAELVVNDAPDLRYAHFESSQTQLKGLLNHQIPLYVCPGCLKAAGKTPADVIVGVKIADKNAFFDFTTGRILTLDY